MQRMPRRVLLMLAALAVFILPVAVFAAGGFTDVDDDSTFKADIDWLASAGVTKGCNPPDNTEFCPKDNVTREQMAAFMHRLADNKVVDAATAVTADSATSADDAAKLDGKDSSSYVEHGEIVLVHGGGSWIANFFIVPSYFAPAAGTTTFSDGLVQMELTGPRMLGGVEYGLQSITYCMQDPVSGAYITEAKIWPGSASIDALVVDSTDRSAAGCYSVDVGESGETFTATLRAAGGGTLRAGGIESHWVPVSDLASVASSTGGTDLANGS